MGGVRYRKRGKYDLYIYIYESLKKLIKYYIVKCKKER